MMQEKSEHPVFLDYNMRTMISKDAGYLRLVRQKR